MYVQFFILFCIISSDDFFKLHSSFNSNGAYMVHINMHSFLPSQQSSFHALLQGGTPINSNWVLGKFKLLSSGLNKRVLHALA